MKYLLGCTIVLSVALFSSASFAVQGVISSLGGRCIVETAWKTYSFGCCDVGVDCPQDGSGVCTVAFGGTTYQGDYDGKTFSYAVKDIEKFEGGMCTATTPLTELKIRARR